MKIIVSEIPDEGLELELTETITSEVVKIVSPVRAHLKIQKTGPEVLVTGRVSGDLELECSRCLAAFPLHVDAGVTVVYDPADAVARDENHELRSDELDTGFYKQDTLDTDELLAEQLILNVPMKPLCSSQCKGICPACGADLNAAGCGCDPKEPDPRMKALEHLLKKKE